MRREQCNGYEEEDNGIDRVTVTERCVGDIEGDGKREWEREEREEIRRAQQEEANEPEKHEREGERVPCEEETGEGGIGSEKILPRGVGAEPGSD